MVWWYRTTRGMQNSWLEIDFARYSRNFESEARRRRSFRSKKLKIYDRASLAFTGTLHKHVVRGNDAKYYEFATFIVILDCFPLMTAANTQIRDCLHKVMLIYELLGDNSLPRFSIWGDLEARLARLRSSQPSLSALVIDPVLNYANRCFRCRDAAIRIQNRKRILKSGEFVKN